MIPLSISSAGIVCDPLGAYDEPEMGGGSISSADPGS